MLIMHNWISYIWQSFIYLQYLFFLYSMCRYRSCLYIKVNISERTSIVYDVLYFMLYQSALIASMYSP